MLPVPNAPLVSVVIPAYNCKSYVGEAIRSVLAQTIGADAVETIVLDDGSSDGTPEEIWRFGDAVRFVQLQHGGVSAARNYGIRIASGELIAFLDADDYWLPERLERACALFRSGERCFVNTEYYVETDGVRSDVSYYESRGLRCLFELSAASQMDFALEDNFINSMVVAPRRALIDAGGFDESMRYGEDWDLWLRLLGAGYAARLVSEPSAVYRYQRPGATTTRHDAAMAADRLRVLSKYPGAVSPYRLRNARTLQRRLRVRQAVGRVIPAYR